MRWFLNKASTSPNKMVNNNTWSDRNDPLDGTNLCINLSPLLLLPLSIDSPLYGRNNRRHAFKVNLAASKEKARTICESKLPQKSMELRMMKRVIQLRYLCSDHHFVYWVLKPRLNEKKLSHINVSDPKNCSVVKGSMFVTNFAMTLNEQRGTVPQYCRRTHSIEYCRSLCLWNPHATYKFL